MSYESKKSSDAVARFKNNQGKEVPLDYFLYACFETEQLQKALDKDSPKIPQWPELHGATQDNIPEEIASQDVLVVSEDLISWYRANFPDLSTAEPWDFSVLSTVTPPLVAMAKDLNTVYELKNGTPLPEYTQQEMGRHQHWFSLEKLINNYFSKKARLICRYFEWNFSGQPKEDFEVGSRPPVGRFAPGFRGDSGGGRPQRGGRGGPPPKRSGGGDFNRGGGGGGNRPPRNEGGGGGGRKPFQDRGDRGDRGDRDRGPRNGPPRQKSDPDIEAMVLQECDQAFMYLSENSDKDSVTLKPQNSFYRRIQHQKIVDAGFHSESSGEGPDRAVVVHRKK